ncbi:ankyrin [Brachyspira hyodysenteriae]|uniref:ankyrin repeat domain-containing protein n=1 Tax=Brachyspira hyodysenteriae TaxID=159 RepID=UPI00063DC83A|nr:ankyrin repeat domain-containing protein [Brachyspira hyodysenteriae]KLI46273.1 ankyrin [Brachyspira hyodysenteriae]
MKHIRFLIILLTFSYSVFALTANETNLFNAINEQNSDNVLNILNNSTDIDINVLDTEGYTPLHRAIYNKDLNTVNVLLENENIDVNSKLDMKVSIDGWYLGGATPLILASYIGDTNIVSVLLENNADIKAKDDVDGSMAIHMASANGNNDVVIMLLDKDPTTINDVDNRGNTPLHWAAMKDKPETVKLLMENGADIESKDADGWTPLHYAAAFSSLQTVQTLVDLGADKMSKTKDGNEPIYYARGDDVKNYLSGNDNIAREGTPEDTLEGNETVVADNNTADENNDTEETAAEETTEEETEVVITDVEVVDDNTQDMSDEEIVNTDLDVKQLELLVAVKNNDIIALNTLIKEGVNPNFVDENGYTPLHLAVINNNLDTVEALLKYKDINKEAKLPYKATLNNWYLGGATPLIVAAYVGNADIVYTLIEAGCDIRARDDIDGAMPIHVASANGNDDAVILLLEKDKTLVNEADKNGNDTPLHWAAMKDKPSTINVLLKYGADTKIQNSDGNTALHYAAMYASSDVIKNIVNADKSSVNTANNENMYPIHYAALENNVDALVSLVQDGKADVNIKDSNNDTALHYAAAYGNMDSVMSLVEKCSADKTLKDDDGYTAADLALDNGYDNIANYLRGAAYIPDNNQDNRSGQELILPEYNKKPNLDKKWW